MTVLRGSLEDLLGKLEVAFKKEYLETKEFNRGDFSIHVWEELVEWGYDITMSLHKVVVYK